MTRESVYEHVTEGIVRELEQGVAPWVKPWSGGGSVGMGMPYNATSQRRYSGVNVLLLWATALERGCRSDAWLTFRQALGLGGHVKRGEHGCSVVYASTFSRTERDQDTGEERERKIPFLKSYTVFNVEQTEGLPSNMYAIVEPRPLDDAIEDVRVFIERIGATVRHGGDRAFYAPSFDVIQLPEPACFEEAGHYYSTSLHEHAHWSGHESRLDRDLSGRFGTQAYAAEELVAELTAAFLCAALSIPGRLRHAEYLGHWVSILKEDTRAIFSASARATEAATYLEGKGGAVVPETSDTEEEKEEQEA
jgi:antirestriction protein ArdC